MSGTRIAAGAGVSLGAMLTLPVGAQADDFQVTNLNPDGTGSLLAAVEAASANPGDDRILFNSKLSGTIEPAGGDLTLTNGDIEILGPGARGVAVSGSDDSTVIEFVDSPAPLDAVVSGLTIRDGLTNGSGGGISVSGDVGLTLSRVTLADNQAAVGGGIHLSDPDASLTVESSTISGNSAVGSDVELGAGGGIYSYDADVSVRNSTLSDNAAVGGDALPFGGGGGAYVGGNASFEVLSSTVTRNHSESNYGGGGLYELGLLGAELRGTIVAGNTASADVYPDLDEGPWNTAFSLIGNTADTGPFLPVEIIDEGGNLLNVDPKLKPLKDNGGPTDTHAFKKSPVKNKIPKGQTPKNDQRGAKRKGQGDIGAYELTKCKGVVVNRVGTSGKDKLKGTKRKDGMLGLGGNDKLKGKKGKDGLCGGRGKDKLIGGPGKDKFNGGPGKDKEIQ